jgi:hypothetical protein
MNNNYVLKLSHNQTKVLRKAIQAFLQVHTGHLGCIASHELVRDPVRRAKLKDSLMALQPLMKGGTPRKEGQYTAEMKEAIQILDRLKNLWCGEDLVLTFPQATIVEMATEIYSRIHMGQLDCIACPNLVDDCTNMCKLSNALRDLEPLVTGLGKNLYYGIESRKVSERAKIAWDLYQVVRHRMAWDMHPKGGLGVCYDEPYQVAKEKLPTMSKSVIE